MKARSEETDGRALRESAVRRICEIDPARGDGANEFQGHHLGASVSVIVVDAPPGSGPKLHRHPYEEVFVVQEGTATFTARDEVIEAHGGQIVVVPAGVAHKFVNFQRVVFGTMAAVARLLGYRAEYPHPYAGPSKADRTTPT